MMLFLLLHSPCCSLSISSKSHVIGTHKLPTPPAPWLLKWEGVSPALLTSTLSYTECTTHPISLPYLPHIEHNTHSAHWPCAMQHAFINNTTDTSDASIYDCQMPAPPGCLIQHPTWSQSHSVVSMLNWFWPYSFIVKLIYWHLYYTGSVLLSPISTLPEHNSEHIQWILCWSTWSHHHYLHIVGHFRNDSGFVAFGSVVREENDFYIGAREVCDNHMISRQPRKVSSLPTYQSRSLFTLLAIDPIY